MACYPSWPMLPRLANSGISFAKSAPGDLALALQPQHAAGILKCCSTSEGALTEEGNGDGAKEAKKKKGRKVGNSMK